MKPALCRPFCIGIHLMATFSHHKLAEIQARESVQSSRPTVMIVDDKDANLSVMSAILRPHYHVLEARDGQEALALIQGLEQAESLACIVSDHRMPNMTGVEFLSRTHSHVPDAMRIIVSGYIDVDAVIDSINKAEVCKFLVKPFDASDFLEAVQFAASTFERRRLLAQTHARLIEETHALKQRVAELEQSKA